VISKTLHINEEPMRKKRLTAESNPENYYTLRVTKEQRIPKFNTTALHYKVEALYKGFTVDE